MEDKGWVPARKGGKVEMNAATLGTLLIRSSREPDTNAPTGVAHHVVANALGVAEQHIEAGHRAHTKAKAQPTSAQAALGRGSTFAGFQVSAPTAGDRTQRSSGARSFPIRWTPNPDAMAAARRTDLGRRIPEGVAQHAAIYRRASQLTGVPAVLIATIHANESIFGAGENGPESGFGLDDRWVPTSDGNRHLRRYGLGTWQRGQSSPTARLQSAVVAAETMKQIAGYIDVTVDHDMSPSELAGLIASYAGGPRAGRAALGAGESYMFDPSDSNPHPVHPGGSSRSDAGTVRVGAGRKEGLLRWDVLIPLIERELSGTAERSGRGDAPVGKPPAIVEEPLTNPFALTELNTRIAWGEPEALEPLMQEAGPSGAPFAYVDDDSCGAASLVAGLVLAGGHRFAPAVAALTQTQRELADTIGRQRAAHPHLQEAVDALDYAGNVLERLGTRDAADVTVEDMHQLRRATYIVANIDGYTREAPPSQRPDLGAGLRIGTMGHYREMLWGASSIDVGGITTDFAQTELRGGGLHFILAQDVDLHNPNALRQVIFDPATSKGDLSAITPADSLEERGHIVLGPPPSEHIARSWDVDEGRSRGSRTANFPDRDAVWS